MLFFDQFLDALLKNSIRATQVIQTILSHQNTMDFIKFLMPVSIIAAIISFALNRTYEWRKEKKRLKRLLSSLYIELGDISQWLARVQITQKKGLKLIAHREATDSLPIRIPIHIYDRYFEEISIYLSASERRSFNGLYSLVELINSRHQELRPILIECMRGEDRLQEVSLILEGTYRNTLAALGLANFHIANQKRFNMKKLWAKHSTSRYLNTNSLTDEFAARLETQITEHLLNLRSEALASTVEKIRQERG